MKRRRLRMIWRRKESLEEYGEEENAYKKTEKKRRRMKIKWGEEKKA